MRAMSAEPILRYWSLSDLDGQSVECLLFRTEHGLEVRCQSGTKMLRSQRVGSMGDGINVAEAWRMFQHIEIPHASKDSSAE